MKFNLEAAVEILQNTPHVLQALLNNLPDVWIDQSEGEDTWSPFDIVGHLIHGEETDWIPRVRIILSDKKDKSFEPFDRFAQFERFKENSLQQLLELFSNKRSENLKILWELNIKPSQMRLTGAHPEFGKITLEELLAAWAVHDLTHIAQIVRVLAKQYGKEVGPFKNYLSILNR